jgi:hypothetical protein
MPAFRIDTEIIPKGVDLDFARERNGLIESYRRGEVESDTAMRGLLRLYWGNQDQIATTPTGPYLMSMSYQFPAEAGIPVDESSRIYKEESKLAER